MAYRNKTFVSFASEDISSYRLMTAWRANAKFDFNFHDAHDLNTARDTSHPDTIRRRLGERLANTKQVVLLVGEQTRRVAARPDRFLYYEVEVIRRLGLPVGRNADRSIPKTVVSSPGMSCKSLDVYRLRPHGQEDCAFQPQGGR